MSVVHIQQIKNKVCDAFAAKIDTSDITDKDKEKDIKITTRCLAAYAIHYASGCSEQEAADAVVDGSDDNGIDAIFYSNEGELYIVQSKYSQDGSGEPSSGDVSKFCRGVKDLINEKFDRFNSKIQEKAPIIQQALGAFNTKYVLILIDTHAQKQLAMHASRFIEDLLDEMNNNGAENPDPVFSFNRISQSIIHESLAKKAGNTPIDVTMSLSAWGKISEPYIGYYGAVSGSEIADWWKTYGDRLFDKNIRKVLGKTDVNDSIEKTIKDCPERFWYYNNGITIIADKIEKSAFGGGNRDLGSFRLTNFAIINGAQTVSTIGKSAYNAENKLENVNVHTRIIQLSETPEQFGEEITKANNRQNRIENRDFVSQDPEQIRIRQELLIDGIEYNLMRSEIYTPSEKSFDITEATVALACASGRTSLVVNAKSNIGKFYENLQRGIYKEIFNPTVTGCFLYNCIQLNRYVENYLKKKVKQLPRKAGREYGVLIHGNRVIEMVCIKRLNLKERLASIDFDITSYDIDSVVDQISNEIVDYLRTNYQDSFLATLFKNATKTDELVRSLLSAEVAQ